MIRLAQTLGSNLSGMKASKILVLTILIVGVYLLHQDSWNWNKTEPMVFGFLPVGLAYHAGYSIVAALLMAVLVKVAWPKHLEDVEPAEKGRTGNPPEGH
jgi:uncharacterized oligopeptide transporter (OPT) family protein